MHTSKRTLLLVGNRSYHVKPMIPKESYFASLTSQLHNTIKQQEKGVLPSSNTSISNSVSTHKKTSKSWTASMWCKQNNWRRKSICHEVPTQHNPHSSDRREINLTMHYTTPLPHDNSVSKNVLRFLQNKEIKETNNNTGWYFLEKISQNRQTCDGSAKLRSQNCMPTIECLTISLILPWPRGVS